MDIVSKKYIENNFINNLNTDKLFIGSRSINEIDTILDDGIYIIWNVITAGGISYPYLLEVYNAVSTGNNTYCRQTLYDSKEGIFKSRHKNITTGTGWNDWKIIEINGTYIKDASITRDKIDANLKFPFINNHISIFNNVNEFDTIFNLVDSLNGIYIPTIGIQSIINTENNKYFRQLLYDANLGTFKYRNKNLNTNTFDDWIPISIPYTTISNISLSENSINEAINTGVYILSNSNALNQTTTCEFIIVHRYNTNVYQVHYAANNTIKTRTGIINSNNIATWNNWNIKQHTYVLFINDTKVFTKSYKNNVLTEADATKITEIITNLKYPTGYDLKLYYRIDSDINAIKLNVNAFVDKIIGSYFDWDTNSTKYYKISVVDNAIKIESKSINFVS